MNTIGVASNFGECCEPVIAFISKVHFTDDLFNPFGNETHTVYSVYACICDADMVKEKSSDAHGEYLGM